VTKLSGVFPVVPTPFSGDGSVDEAAFLRLVDFALESGVDGLVFPGMASEVETLTPEERGALVAALGRHLSGRIPFIAGASDTDPARAAARAEEGRRAGAQAAMIMAPHALGRDPARQAEFFRAVAECTDLPIMLQNAPAPMGAGLSPEEVAEVVELVPAIRFVKEETLPCGQNVSLILGRVGERLDGVFGGAGARYVIDELARGAAGTMPAIELADVHVELVRAWESGDRTTARRLYRESLPVLVFQAVFRVRATKAVLQRRGLLDSTLARAAGPRLDAHDVRELDALVCDARSLFKTYIPDLPRDPS
jgi:4-hydroxy-tetrahydrodipicolinate synthase